MRRMENQEKSSGYPKGAVGALVLLFVINLFNYIDRQILSAVEPLLRKELGLDRAQTGMLSTAFLVSYMIGAPLLGSLADRFSRWIIIGASVMAWSLASGWTGMVSSFAGLVTARIFVGIGEAGYGPAAPALIADYFSEKKRGRMMSFFYLAIPVGSALGYVLGGALSAAFQSWKAPFLAVVIPGLILGGICFIMSEPRQNKAGSEARPKAGMKDYLALLRIPSYLLNTAAMTAMTFAIGGISFWVPSYIVDFRGHELAGGASLTTEQLTAKVGMIFGGIVVVGGLISTLLGGWCGDKLRERFGGAYFLVSGFGIFLAFPATVAMLYLPFPYAWGAIFCAVFFLFFNTGPANAALANVTSSHVRATAFALNIFLIHALGDAISPPLIGWISEWKFASDVFGLTTKKAGMDFAMLLVAAVMIAASALWLYGARYLAADTAAASAIDDQDKG